MSVATAVSNAVNSAGPAMFVADTPTHAGETIESTPGPRKRGRPRKGTTCEGPVPVIQEKAVVLSAYQQACRKLESGVRNQHVVILSHSESQALAYGIRRLCDLAAKCSGSPELNGQSC